ncbi:MAG TPA: penicillin-binding protein 2 [Solirubrobacteraceae bacterium]|nr:penicillin-binding protein 2 [Solirubrobacteraceae bacterium]
MALIQKRIGLLFAAFLLLLLLAGLRALQLGTLEASSLRNAAVTQQDQRVTVPARRGEIVDRRGVELAVTEPAEDVSATPYQVKDPAAVARRIAPLLDRPEDDVLRQLTRRDTGFVYLARALPSTRARKIQKLGVEGLAFTPANRRVYPREWLASQVIGTVGTDGKGLSGLEYRYDRRLHGVDGERHIVSDPVGRPLSVRDPVPAKPGARIELAIDAAIQDKTEEVLADVGAKFQPKGATAVVMDPRNGEVLALANWPRVDANDVGGAPDYARQNRAVGFNYEPGSTFKAFTVAGALEDRKIRPDTMFDLPPQIQVADRVIEESHPRGYVTLSTAEILAQSSNVGAVIIGKDKLGARRFDHWVRRFGFGRRTGVDLPGEEMGQVLPLAKYSGSSIGNLPIGQGLSVTPIQMASAYAAIANGGILRPARVVRSVDGRPTPVPRGRRVISEKTALAVRLMLEGVFAEGGTASEASVRGYELAGKTGTSQKIDEATGEYSEDRHIASFVGFAPAERPRLLVAVMVDEPNGLYYGGEVAAPAFQEIMQFALPYLRIPPE